MKRLRVAEFFAGIGGVASGFLDTGRYSVAFLQDVDPLAREVFVRNYPRLASRYHLGDVRRLSGTGVLKTVGEVDGLLGCPPCQGFSAAGKRDDLDERNELLLDYCRLIKGVAPRFFLLENVPSLLSSSLYARFTKRLATRYRLTGAVVNAAEYGVPQLRRRAVVLGLRRDLGVEPTLPVPTHGGLRPVYDYASGSYVRPNVRDAKRRLQLDVDYAGGRHPLVRLEEALGDLPQPGQNDYLAPSAGAFQRLMRAGAGVVTNHVAWNHTAEMRRRLGKTAPGDAPSELGDRSRNSRYFSQAYSRLHRHGLARTLTTNFHNPGSGRFTHYESARTLTLREALRLQTFPDSYSFDLDAVDRTDAERMIGNAFPRRLARAMALHIARLLG